MEVCFTINDREFKVSEQDVPPETTLNTFIRNHAHLSGTKFMCREGVCGACIVNMRGIHPVTKEITSVAVASCLVSIFSCHGRNILTVEGIGSKHDGYHPIQRRLALLNGTQCGFCTPGFVMSMYSMMTPGRNSSELSMEEIENHLDSNICRCTGYRPILDAFKSFAVDADERLKTMCSDIEDLEKVCGKDDRRNCSVKCSFKNIREDKKSLKLKFKNETVWYIVSTIEEIFEIFKSIGERQYTIVAGNTARGEYPSAEDTKIFIDISSVEELHKYYIGNELIVGANVSLSEFIKILRLAACSDSRYKYCNELAKHVEKIANTAIRNIGTVAGNLFLKKEHREFQSDLYLILETVGAQLTIVSRDGSLEQALPEQLMGLDMHQKLLTCILLPGLDPVRYIFRSYKLQPIAQNAKALVSAAFLVKLDQQSFHVEQARLCFGGIHPSFTHAAIAERTIIGKCLFKNDNLKMILKALEMDLEPDLVLPDPSPEFRKQAALGLFYRFVLNIAPKNTKLVKSQYLSGSVPIDRPLSTGSQSYSTNPRNWPLTKYVPKLEALAQTAGEAKFINDLPEMKGELYAAFVIATKPKTKILRINPTKALEMEGVTAFYSSGDIPGKNDFMVFKYNVNHFFPVGVESEEIFCSGEVLFHGQAVGIILAERFELANRAARFVEVEYGNLAEDPIYPTVADVMANNAKDRLFDVPNERIGSSYLATNRGSKTIKGNFVLSGQYHYTMETQTCVCIPTEDGMDVYSSSQSLHQVQGAIAQMLELPQNRINYYVRRIGGAFGGKLTRATQIACACALGAYLTRRPVRFIMTIESNMTSIGKRQGLWTDYEVSVNRQGQIARLEHIYIHDSGCIKNPSLAPFSSPTFKNCYDDSSWRTIPKIAITDVPANTYLRASGSAEAICTTETIMEHVAFETGIDALKLRLMNMHETSKMRNMLPQFIKDVEYETRKQAIKQFNSSNRWRKKGLSIVPIAFPIIYLGGFDALVSIHHLDGTVSITHSGVEMGQGINTKAAQVAAFILGIPLNLICVKPMSSITSPQANLAGGSYTSESVAFAVQKACEILRERIQPVRGKKPSASWEALTHACFAANISLTARYATKAAELVPYTVWGLACSELELDVLTGSIRLPRVDILVDVGESMSPGIDIGQVEGAFVMGLGYFLTESLVYDKTNGALLNNRAANYKPPGPKDVPTDFRLRFLQDSTNPVGILGSKAIGEPTYILAVSALFALRYALESAREDAGLEREWLPLGSGITVDKILPLTGNTIEQFKLT
ncbi:aldehyde oxidase 3-like [Uranotaenia lowii]|uniref:aldehyde oxidase 3-like n=1 Tax=Uranotaenia lowii TaxID=190385 RepID=UPI0024786B9F|nr:aldehyde oxidase 3-like [Uranotaenia lowii]